MDTIKGRISVEATVKGSIVEPPTDYNDLANKPKINNVELKGNKTLDELNVYSKDDIGGLLSHKVDNDKASINRALNKLDFKECELSDDTQFIAEDNETSNLLKLNKLVKVFDYIKSKLALDHLFLRTNSQTLTKEQKTQARMNIHAANGGKRKCGMYEDIGTHTSVDNPYICPSDGYVRYNSSGTNTANVNIGTSDIHYVMDTVTGATFHNLWVSEGMPVYFGGTLNRGLFITLEHYGEE